MLPIKVPDTDEAIEAAHEKLTQMRRWRRINNKASKFGDSPVSCLVTGGVMAIAFLPLFCAASFSKVWSPAASSLLLLLTMLILVSSLFIIFLAEREWKRRASRIQQHYDNARYTLVMSNNVRAIGPLAEINWQGDSLGYAVAALTRLLPRLQPEDAALLDTKQRRCLYRLLQPPYSWQQELDLAILQGLEQVGDTDTLIVLNDLLQDTNLPPVLVQPMQNCRATISERETQAYRHKTLLRPSAISAAPTNQLLRPTTFERETPPEQLLRAVSNDKVL